MVKIETKDVEMKDESSTKNETNGNTEEVKKDEDLLTLEGMNFTKWSKISILLILSYLHTNKHII